MALKPGSKLGVYEVTAKIGAGGMGEVYRAHDTTLDRDVAIKVLPDAFATDPERLARFEREAKVLASLNHPNIAAIYGLEKSADTRALILELVEGPTLQDRIAKGPIPLDEALPIARQIAEALEAAHEQGIIHRDLKPANVKVKDDGTVKVLDFGLAKALGPELSDLDAANSPTMTMTAAATKMGVIMGTAAYMSPEQAAGKTVDRRADIWAFGALLWEMLTGRQLFDGETVSHVLAAVLTREIAWADLPAGVPPELRRLLRRCLDRDAKRRLRDVGEARVSLDDAAASSDPASAASDIQPVAPPAFWHRPVPALLTVLGVAVLAGLAGWSLTRPAPAPITRTSIVLPQTQQRTNPAGRGVAISPTGTHVVYVANSQLYLRALDELEAQPLTGTEGSGAMTPFFSPDGEWIGFFSARDGALKKVALSGGAAVTLAEATTPYGASWGTKDTIVFGQFGQGILRVAGAGGTPDVLVSVDPPAIAHQPQMLPGGEAVLYTLGSGPNQWDAARIVVEQVATGERTVVVEGGSDARYVATGHLVYTLAGTLLAVPFDVDRLQVTGGPVPLVEGVNRAGVTGAANADISRTGTLVYLPGGSASLRTLVWVDREGNEEPLALEPGTYLHPEVSPDGTRLVIEIRELGNTDVWIYDLTRETLSRLTFDPAVDERPLWTLDGQRVVFTSHRDGAGNLFWKAADGTGEVERLTTSEDLQSPHGWSSDGTQLVLNDRLGISVLSLEGERQVAPLLEGAPRVAYPTISPDGQWLAYKSVESGPDEIYVRPFPDVGSGRWQISTDEGDDPVWAPDGRELFYRGSGGRMMAVPIEAEPTFNPGIPEALFEGRYLETGGVQYDIAPDGQRFLMIKEGGTTADLNDPFLGLTRIHVVQNWFTDLQARVPTGR